MIVVTDANGQRGRAIAQNLLGRVAPTGIEAVTRLLEKAVVLADRGIEFRAGDFADANSLKAAFLGADQTILS